MELAYPPPSGAEVEERVELYLSSLSGPSWPIVRANCIFKTFFLSVFSTKVFYAFLVSRMRATYFARKKKVLIEMLKYVIR